MSKALPVPLALGAAMLFMVVGCGQGAVNSDCSSNEDCESNICHAGICASQQPAEVGNACTGNGECKSYNCESGKCAAGTTAKDAACRDNSECKSQNCENGKCAPGKTTSGSDCLNDEECENGVCKAGADGPGKKCEVKSKECGLEGGECCQRGDTYVCNPPLVCNEEMTPPKCERVN